MSFTPRGVQGGYPELDSSSRVSAANAPVKAVYATGGGQALSAADIGAVATSGLLANLSLGGFKLTNSGDASANSDIPNYGQLLSAVQGVVDIGVVHAIADRTALPAYTVSGGGDTLTSNTNVAFASQDGVAAALNNLYGVVNPDSAGAAHADEGVYQLTQVGSGAVPWILTRVATLNAGDVASGRTFNVDQGTTYAETSWWCVTSKGSDVVGTNTLKFKRLEKVTDHGNLAGLADDDHTIYLLASGGRALSGNMSLGGFKLTNSGNPSAASDVATFQYASMCRLTPSGAAKTANFNAVWGESYRIDATSGAVVATLPAAGGNGSCCEFVRVDSTLANAVTIQRNGTDTLNNGTSTTQHTLTAKGMSALIRDYASGESWVV